MMLRRILFAVLVAAASCGAGTPPPREVRAVWITTILGLDWPKSVDPIEQQRSLRRIVRELSAAKYNTIYFQVRGRGDAMYRSLYEPWSVQLTGTAGKDPGWDPLAFLVEEAHANGMEVHAWFNTFLARGAQDRISGSLHIVDRHPEWAAQANGGEWWLDPGLPEVRDYLVRVGLDIVRNYDIDGFQFDFLRYPAAPFPDDATYRRFGGGAPKGDWRRENVTRLVSAFHDSVRAIKPFLKLGATPLGIYKNSERIRGLQSYEEVYQDSRGWLAAGLLDYLAPQIYWSIGEQPGNPDFSLLAKEWSEHASGRQIIIGIGAYKPEVADEMTDIIDLTRAVGAAGHAFFRYSNVAGSDAVASRYPYPVPVPPMAWKSTSQPAPPSDVMIAAEDAGVRLAWRRPGSPAAGGPLLVKVYRNARMPVDRNDPRQLLALSSFAAGEFIDTTATPGSDYSYALSVLDRAGAESDIVVPVRAPVSPAASLLARKAAARTALGEALPLSSFLLVPYEVAANSPVAITILDGGRQRVGSVVDEFLEPGRYVAAANIGAYRKGWYTLVMVAGEYRTERRFQVE